MLRLDPFGDDASRIYDDAVPGFQGSMVPWFQGCMAAQRPMVPGATLLFDDAALDGEDDAARGKIAGRQPNRPFRVIHS